MKKEYIEPIMSVQNFNVEHICIASGVTGQLSEKTVTELQQEGYAVTSVSFGSLFQFNE